MKRTLVSVLIALIAVFSSAALTLTASAALVPTDYSAFGQQTLDVPSGGPAAVPDGKIDSGEYAAVLTFDDSTPGISKSADTFTAYPSSVRVGITLDSEFLWLGIEVNEPNYKYRIKSTNTAGSYMAFSMGFNMGGKFYQCMDRNTLTLSVCDDGSLFKANSVLIYDEAGKFTTTYHADVYKEAVAVRDDTAGRTVYEVKLDRKLLAGYNSAEDIGEVCYLHFINMTYDASGAKAEYRYRCILSNDAKAQITAQDGWVASFAPELLRFSAAAEATTAAEVTTRPAATTAPEATSAPGQNTEPSGNTGDGTFIWIAAACAAATVATAVIVTRRRYQ